MKRKYIVYKVTNRFDGKIYIGCHLEKKKNDYYMGSGTEIKKALKELGRKSFIKETLFEFDTKEEMLAKEKKLVTKEFCMRADTYNRIEGGGTYVTEGMVTVKNKNGITSTVYCNDPRYLSGELIHNNIGSCFNKKTFVAKDKNNIFFRIECNDPRYLSGELVGINKNKNFISHFKNKKHTQNAKNKMSERAKERTGDKNSQFGTCWITKEGLNKKIKKEDFDKWINQGWVKGMIRDMNFRNINL